MSIYFSFLIIVFIYLQPYKLKGLIADADGVADGVAEVPADAGVKRRWTHPPGKPPGHASGYFWGRATGEPPWAGTSFSADIP